MASAPDLRPAPPGGPTGGPPGSSLADIGDRLQAIAAEAVAPEDALEPALAAVVEVSGIGAGALCLFDPRQELLRLAAEVGLSDEGCRRLRSVRRGDVAGWDMPLHGLLNRRAYLIDSAAKNRYVPPLCESAAAVRTVVCLPLYSGPMPLGSLVLIALAPKCITERDIRTFDPAIKELVKMIEAVRRRAQGGRPSSATPPASTTLSAAADGRQPSEIERIELLIASLAATERERARLAAALATFEEASAARAERLPLESGEPGAGDAEIDRLTSRLAEAEGALAAERARVTELERLAEAGREPGGATAAGEPADRRALEEALTAARQAEAARAAAVAQADEARAALAASETLAQGLRDGAARAQQEIERELASLREEHERLLGARQEREGELAKLAARLETGAAEGERLRGSLAAAEAEREALRAAVAAAEAGRQEAYAARAPVEAEREQIIQSLTAFERERAELRAALESAEAECGRLRDGQSGVEAELAEARDALAAAREALAAAEASRAPAGGPEPMVTRASVALRGTAAPPEPAPQAASAASKAVSSAPPAASVAPKAASATSAAAPPKAPPTEPAPPEAPGSAAEGSRTIAVLDVDGGWERATVNGHRVALLGVGADLGDRLREVEPERIVANLAAPGVLDALAALRAAGSKARFHGCIAAHGAKKALPLGLLEPAVQPVDPDAVVGALGTYVARGTRVVTIGSDVDVLVTLRQAMARQGMSVSMAWDAKQAADLLVMVKPQLVVVDLNLRREGYGIVAGLAALDPIPNLVVIRGSADPSAGFASVVAEPKHAARTVALESLLLNVLRAKQAPTAAKK